jgi:hypothetical protein
MRHYKIMVFVALFLLAALNPANDGITSDALKISPGTKVDLESGDHLVFSFAEVPQLGTVIAVVRIFNRDGVQVSGYRVEGSSDMPSMRGHHASGWRSFALNKKKNYLLPVDIVMRGDWEIVIRVFHADELILQAKILFDV